MNENDEPAVALPLTDPEVENKNQGIEQENHQDLPSSNSFPIAQLSSRFNL